MPDLTDEDRAAIVRACGIEWHQTKGATQIVAAYIAGLAAGRARAIEDCRLECDAVGRKYRYSSNAGMAACDECAAAIRALLK